MIIHYRLVNHNNLMNIWFTIAFIVLRSAEHTDCWNPFNHFVSILPRLHIVINRKRLVAWNYFIQPISWHPGWHASDKVRNSYAIGVSIDESMQILSQIKYAHQIDLMLNARARYGLALIWNKVNNETTPKTQTASPSTAIATAAWGLLQNVNLNCALIYLKMK